MTRGRVRRTTHGDYGYARGCECTCEPCRNAVKRYAKRLAYDLDRGVRRLVDAQPARDHVQGLVDAGATVAQIARATGDRVKRAQIARLLYGNPYNQGKVVRQLQPATAQHLLAVTEADALGQLTFTSAVGTHRRVHALAARGFTRSDIADRLGISESATYNWMTRSTVTTAVADRMRRVYEDMCMKEGTSELMRWRALRLGWAPPLAWDEDSIDDPDGQPDWSGVRCAVDHCGRPQQRSGLCENHARLVRERGGFDSSRRYRDVVMQLNRGQRNNRDLLMDEVAELREVGLSPEAAAQRLGRGEKYVRKIWGEAS